MNALFLTRTYQLLTSVFLMLVLTACGEGSGPTTLPGTPAPPPPPVAEGFCDPVNFEDACDPAMINNFSGGATEVVENPDASGINTSDSVARMQKFADAVFGGTTIDLPEAVDFSEGEVYTMKVWSPRSVPILFKFEGLDKERSVSHTGSGSWELLCFDFSGDTAGPATSAITIIFDLGVNGNAADDPDNWTFYYDDIEQVTSCPDGGGTTTGTSLPVDFEADASSYDFGTDAGFGGGATGVVDNPDASGINSSGQVAQMQKFAGEVFGGSSLNLAGNIDFSAGEVFTAKVWASRAVPLLFKFEGLEQERSVTHSGSSAWEELCFDFTGSTTGPASSAITFIFDLGVNGDAENDPDNWTFYFDDIEQTTSCGDGGGATNTVTVPVDFEAVAMDYDFGADAGFGGGASSVITNPDQSGINASAQVAQMQKFAGEVFGGSTLNLASDVDFSTGEVFTMKVWSSRTVPVLFKFEGLNQERSVDHTGGSEWQELCFDFTGSTAGPASSAITFIFDLGVNGDAENDPDNWTFYYDDIQQVASCPGGGGTNASIPLPVTFEDATLDYELTDFGGVVTSLVADPEDAANTVASSNKAPGAEVWGGTTVADTSGFDAAIPFTATDTQITVRVYSPDAGIPVRLKVEDKSDPTISVETEATTTVANAWETLTFDFANQVDGTAALNIANTYDKASIFFNFGTDGNTAGDKTYLWDDLTFVTGGGGNTGGDSAPNFESGAAMFSDFAGAVATVIANPDASGINTSAQVGQMQKFAGETFAGSTLDLGGPVDLASADSYKMKVWSARSVVVTFKLETGGQETTATHSGGSMWEELCFDFTSVTGPVTGLTIIFDNGTAGDAENDPDNWTFYFDEIEQTSDACSTGGGSTNFSTITFDDAAITYGLVDFGGNASVVQNDPAGGGNMVVEVVKTDTAELWAGTTIATEANDAVPAIPLDAGNTMMTVRVYSPDAGIPVRLKIEDSTDPTITVETEAVTTVANAWETLTFDFSNQVDGTAAFNPANTYDKISIFFNFGTDGATAGEKVYYFDDVDVSTGTSGMSISLPVTFDVAGLDYELTDFGGVVTSQVADPEDAANTVASSNKAPGAELWGGTTVANTSGFDAAIPFTATGTQMSVRVYSPDTGIPVRLKVEDKSDATLSVETEAMTTVANAWETLTFDFATQVDGTAPLNISNTYDKASIFFNFGTDGNTAGDKTYLWEDLTFVTGGGGGGSATFSTITFDDGAITYALAGFGGAEDSTFVTDPDGGANLVARVLKNDTAMLWAGTTFSTEANDAIPTLPLDAANTTMTIRVYSPDAGIPVRLKIEAATDPTISVETEAMTTVSNTWETLTFDFANEAAGTAAFNAASTYNKASIFFNFGTEGATAGEKIYFFDDVAVP